jgi:hypothetical protein
MKRLFNVAPFLIILLLPFNTQAEGEVEGEVEYQLYRDKGVLLFNSNVEKVRYWVSVQAAAQGGGSMYAEITKENFENVWSGKKDVMDFYDLFKRSYNRKAEQGLEVAYKIEEIISLHMPNLGSNPNPVKSVVLK